MSIGIVMEAAVKSPYRRARVHVRDVHRVVVEMPKEEIDAIDQWGVPAGMESRTEAVRTLLKKALDAAAVEDRKA